MSKQATLIFFCGKMGSGKSTKAIELANEYDAILLSEDEWLSAIYPEEIKVFDDYKSVINLAFRSMNLKTVSSLDIISALPSIPNCTEHWFLP